MSTTRRLLVVAAILVVVVAIPLAWGLVRDLQNEAGMGVPTENLVDEPSAPTRYLSGELRVAGNGCFHLAEDGDSFVIVWPEGSTQDGATVISPNGQVYGAGGRVVGRGWIREVAEVVAAADGPDGYMGMVMGYCAEDGERVVVFETLVEG